MVIKSNGINGLLTCCIRPSSIFGPGDKLLVPSLVEAAKAGKSKVKVVYSIDLKFYVVQSSVCSIIPDLVIQQPKYGFQKTLLLL